MLWLVYSYLLRHTLIPLLWGKQKGKKKKDVNDSFTLFVLCSLFSDKLPPSHRILLSCIRFIFFQKILFFFFFFFELGEIIMISASLAEKKNTSFLFIVLFLFIEFYFLFFVSLSKFCIYLSISLYYNF